jgi:ABC-type Fe3+-hydroxamate transport system substrate-binding protein
MFRAVFRSLPVRALLFALAVVIIAGCAKRRSTLEPSFTVRPIAGETNAVSANNTAGVSITPVASPVGRITSVNQQVMIAVVTFPIGQVPAAGGRYSVFRAGQKVGELKMSEEAADTLRVADITSGTLEVGDEVRTP